MFNFFILTAVSSFLVGVEGRSRWLALVITLIVNAANSVNAASIFGLDFVHILINFAIFAADDDLAEEFTGDVKLFAKRRDGPCAWRHRVLWVAVLPLLLGLPKT